MALADAKPYAVAAWTLDEASGTRYDSVGSSDLTDNNTVASGTGKFGDAADFEASNSESLSCADNPDLRTGDVIFCFRAWIYAETLLSFPVIAHKGWGGSAREWVLYANHSTNRLVFSVSSDGSAETSVQADDFGTLSTGNWYLVHVWHDSDSNEIGISVNGVATTATHSSGVYGGAGTFQIGASSSQSLYWDGLIDDPVFLKGYALDATERSEDYNSGTGVAFADWDAGGGSPAAIFLPAFAAGWG